MAGPHIRWRRESSSLPPTAALAKTASSEGALDAVWGVLAVAVVLTALAARLFNASWDEGTHLHPDERHLTLVAADIELPSDPIEYFDSADSTLNPYNRSGGGSFVYGTLPLFLTKAVGVALGEDNYDSLVLVGRRLSALFDAGTVLLVFLLGRRLFNPLAGLFGALFYATAPLAIQHAHFFVVDPYLTFFVTLALYFCVRAAQDGRLGDFVFAGLAIGLGTAAKLTALALLPVLGAAVLMQMWPHLSRIVGERPAGSGPPRATIARSLLGLFLALSVTLIAFRVAQPYAFETPGLSPLSWVDLDDRFVADQRAQIRLLSGDVNFPPSVQWIGRASYFYPLQEMVRWGMGPAFGLAGWAALLYAGFRLVRFRDMRLLLPVLFVLVYFGFMGRQFSLYLRYFLPLYPVLAVLAGFALVDLLRWARERSPRLRSPWRQGAARGVPLLVASLLALALFLGLAYLNIYSRPVTRVEASRWLYETAPTGSVIAVEHWDDALPLRLPGTPDKQFEVVALPLYELDTPEKIASVIAILDGADYVTLSSNRLLNSIPRNPINYPVTSRYHELLIEERLGFRLLRRFTSYPGLLGVDLPDDRSEESWTSYDHPPVLVFEKTPDYVRVRLEALLGSGPFAQASLTPAQADRNGLLLSPADAAVQREGGTWTDVFSDGGFVGRYPTLLWLLLVEGAAIAVTPAALMLLRRLPDRGYLLTKPLGLLLLAYPVWLIVSLKLADFDRTLILGWLAVLMVGGIAFARWQRTDLLGFVRANWRLILFSELLFLAAFFFLLVLRLENPDLWHPFRGGEKPMDLAYLTAVTRSTTLPPYDPWFAGGYLNYYYLGQFFTATLSKATTIPPEVAFNLAVPTYFAFTIGAAFSVAFSFAATARRYIARGFLRTVPAWSPYVGGLLGAVFVGLLGNLDGVGQLVDRLTAVSAWQVDLPVPVVGAVINSIGGLWQVVVHGADLQPFDYWRSSRMLPPTISITEFPYFTFLFADLHAHLMAIPFEVLAIGVGLALVIGRPGRHALEEWGLIALLGLIVGSLRWLNSWDYPTFLLVALAAVAISERRLEGGAITALARLAIKALLLVGLSYALYLPFSANYLAPVAGVQAAPETTPVHQYLAHFGVFIAAITLWLLYSLVRAGRLTTRKAPALAAGGVLLLTATLFAAGYALVAFLLPLLAVVAYLALRELRLRRADGGVRLFLLSLVGLGLGLSMGVDLVTINGDIVRMNTVFKFYLHTWVLFALVGSAAVWSLLFVFWRRPRGGGPAFARLPALLGGAALAALVAGALLYPSFATPVRLNDRFADLPATLEGTAYMRGAVYEDPHGPIDLSLDYAGIRWLRANVEGTPVIVEGRTDLYRWGSRISIYTGLPTVLGWDWHQRQQRGDLAHMVDLRARQVDDFYADPDARQALRFLQTYGVEYVILGRLERLYYPEEGLRKLGIGLGGALEPVFSNPGLTIFRVRPVALADALS